MHPHLFDGVMMMRLMFLARREMTAEMQMLTQMIVAVVLKHIGTCETVMKMPWLSPFWSILSVSLMLSRLGISFIIVEENLLL